MLKLNNSLSIYLMKKDNNGKDLTKLNNGIIKELLDAFGGATVVDGQGYWVDNDTLYKDDNIIVKCNYSELSNEMKINFLKAIKDEFEKAQQLAVSVELNGELYILENIKDVEKLSKLIQKSYWQSGKIRYNKNVRLRDSMKGQ